MNQQAGGRRQQQVMAWFRDQVDRFSRRRSTYQRLGRVLEEILGRVVAQVCPTAIVQVRAKTVKSFAEKLLRKQHKYFPGDAMQVVTDLCGARVIVQLESEVQAVCDFINAHFDVDPDNSDDTRHRLRADQFGYRSVHYVVQLREGVFLTRHVNTRVPRALLGMTAEVQVRTIAQHAWADIGHDRLYKSAFKVPATFERQAASIAALLENADQTFSNMVDAVNTLQTNVGAYMDRRQAEAEYDRLRAVRRYARSDPELLDRMARLLISLGRFDEAVKMLRPYERRDDHRLQTWLGVAECQANRSKPRGAAYRRGQRHMARACELAPNDVEARTYLAQSWAGVDERQALSHYHAAFEIDSTEPRALAGYLRHQVAKVGDLSVVSLVRPNIEAAIEKCNMQARVGVNLPWALFFIAEFELLLKRPYAALAAAARAVSLATSPHMIDEALDAMELLSNVEAQRMEIEWGRRLFLLARAARFAQRLDGSLRKLASRKRMRGPIVIVAGGCDPSLTRSLGRYGKLLRTAFSEFSGTIIGGGTKQGVSGLVGDVIGSSRGRLHGVGYLPRTLPSDGSATADRRYEIRRSDGRGRFTPLEPLQAWIDLAAQGVDPSQVALIGFNGGQISGFEYRLAAALGARVGIVRHSGRAADELLAECRDDPIPMIHELPNDVMTVRAFIHHAGPSPWRHRERESLARAVHEEYRAARRESLVLDEPPLADWERLRDDLRISNMNHADHIVRKLAAIGMRVVKAQRGQTPKIIRLSRTQIEMLAEMEHGRWNVEKLLDGWQYAAHRDDDLKLHDCLAPWSDLPPAVKALDRKAVARIPALLAEIGYEIVPV